MNIYLYESEFNIVKKDSDGYIIYGEVHPSELREGYVVNVSYEPNITHVHTRFNDETEFWETYTLEEYKGEEIILCQYKENGKEFDPFLVEGGCFIPFK